LGEGAIPFNDMKCVTIINSAILHICAMSRAPNTLANSQGVRRNCAKCNA
jgi:hypothetical protein